MSEVTNSTKTPLLSNQVYDILNNVVQLGLPGVGAFYASLAILWGFPNGDKVVGTCAALAILLGILIKISNVSYNKTLVDKDGVLDVFPTVDGSELGKLSINLSADEIAGKNLVTFKVNTVNPPTDSQ